MFERDAVHEMAKQRVHVHADRQLSGPTRQIKRRHHTFVSNRPHEATVQRAPSSSNDGKPIGHHDVSNAESGTKRIMGQGPEAKPQLSMSDSARRSVVEGRRRANGRVIVCAAVCLRRLHASPYAISAGRDTLCLAAAGDGADETCECIHREAGTQASRDSDRARSPQ